MMGRPKAIHKSGKENISQLKKTTICNPTLASNMSSSVKGGKKTHTHT